MTRSDGVTLENKITIDQKQANDAIKQLVSSVNSLAKAFKDATGDSEKLSDSAKKNSQKSNISSLISDISGMNLQKHKTYLKCLWARIWKA